MRLPDALEVQLTFVPSRPVALPDVLVALDMRQQGRYYFGTVMGLTDAHGRVQVSRAEVMRHFEENQRLFPMDYRVPLADCDSEIAVRVQGGADFREARLAAEDNALMLPEVLEAWRRARNEHFASTALRIDLREHDRGRVSVLLPVSLGTAS